MEEFDLRLWKQFTAAGGDSASPVLIDQIAIDSRRVASSRSLFVALPGSQQDGHQHVAGAAQAGARYALVQKDWIPPSGLSSITLLRVANPLRALQEIAAAYRKQLSAIVIAITGSYGKTLLKDLLHAILATTHQTMASPESFNSQIGVPLSLLAMRRKDRIAIIEAGISLKGEMALLAETIAPDCSIVTTIGQAHLNTLKDLETTAAEKMKLVQAAPQRWSLVPQEPLIARYTQGLPQELHCWSQKAPHLPHADYITSERADTMSYQVSYPDGSRFEGVIRSGFSYYLDLINIAVKAAWLLQVPAEAISLALKNHIPEQMRTEFWKSPLGVTFINNTYCSDPQSVDLALKHLEQAPEGARRIFVFGGLRDNHSPDDQRRVARVIQRAIQASKVDLLVLYGDVHVEEVADIETWRCTSYSEVLKRLSGKLKNGDFVLVKGARKEQIDSLMEAFDDSISNNQCIINLSAVQSNIEAIRSRLSPGTRMMAVVKALAYGTDEVRMSNFLNSCGIDILAVSYVEEGAALKRAGVKQAIFSLNAAPYEARKAVKYELEVGVSDRGLIEALAREAAQQEKHVRVHLHVDTGMSRFGCRPEEALELACLIKDSPALILEGIFTHFASADDPQQDAFTLNQVALFESTIKQLKAQGIDPPWQHAANSSGAIRFQLPQFNMVRIGLAIYGLYPSEAVKQKLELRLALSLTSRIVGIN
jgi:UDP-N-acetylmuramoyl-tripeptide--D-alanyl-D-alanine ligase